MSAPTEGASPPTKPPPWAPPAKPPRAVEGLGLILRPFEPTDAAALFEAVDRSRESLLPWLPWAKSGHRSLDSSRETIERFIASMHDPLNPAYADSGYVTGVFDAADGRLLGGTGFNRIEAGTAKAETGYWLRADARGRGVITRATRLNISRGFTPQRDGGYGLRRIVIYASTANERSCRVPDRIGLRREVHATRDRWVDGIGWTDTLGWAVLAEEWDCATHTLRS